MDNSITQDKFMWTRLWMHIKREIQSNKKQIRWQLALIVGIILITEILICSTAYDNWNERSSFYDPSFKDPAFLSIIFAMIGLGLLIISIAASMAFSPFRTKAGKINQLMCVGTTHEKFLTRILIYSIAPAILFLISACVIDMIRCMMVDSLMPIKAHYILGNIFKDETRVKAVLFFCSFSACVSAFYTTVSIFSPKHAFLKGLCLTIAIQTIGMWGLVNFGKKFVEPWEYHPGLAYWTALTTMTAIAIILLFVSYLKYKETEL